MMEKLTSINLGWKPNLREISSYISVRFQIMTTWLVLIFSIWLLRLVIFITYNAKS